MNVVVGVLVGRRTCYHEDFSVILVKVGNNAVKLPERIAYLSGDTFHSESVVRAGSQENINILAGIGLRGDNVPVIVVEEAYLVKFFARNFTVNAYAPV